MVGRAKFLTAAQAALQLGVTAKALRVLERHALVQPGRTAAGWRAYGPDELARLHQVLALRSLGLTLAQVARLLWGRATDLDHTLALQEDALVQTQADTDRALRLVRQARSQLAAGELLSTADLTELIRETNVMAEHDHPSHEMEALIERHYAPAQLEQLKARTFTPEDQERVSAAWSAIYAEAGHLLAAGADPSSPPALDLARRSRDLIAEFTGGDPGIAASLSRLWSDATSRPEVAAALPGSPALNAFLSEARAHLEAEQDGLS